MAVSLVCSCFWFTLYALGNAATVSLPPLVTPLWVFFKDVGRQTQLSYFGAILYMHQQNGVFQ